MPATSRDDTLLLAWIPSFTSQEWSANICSLSGSFTMNWSCFTMYLVYTVQGCNHCEISRKMELQTPSTCRGLASVPDGDVPHSNGVERSSDFSLHLALVPCLFLLTPLLFVWDHFQHSNLSCVSLQKTSRELRKQKIIRSLRTTSLRAWKP